jgi:hypothetical protein
MCNKAVSLRETERLRSASCHEQARAAILTHALVAQWIERLVAVQKVAGSTPAERTKRKKPPNGGFFLLCRSQRGETWNHYQSYATIKLMSFRKPKPITPTHIWTLLMGLIGVALWITANSHQDPDVWWRIRYGHLLLQSGIPAGDPFSYTMPSFQFVSHAWSTDITIAFILQKLGWGFVAGLFAGIALLTLGLVTFRLRKRWAGSILLVVLYVTFTTVYGVRAQVVGWLLFAVLLNMLITPPAKWSSLRWLLIPYALLWANLHGSFILAPVLIGLRGVFEDGRQRWATIGIAVLGFGASIINPYGAGLWREVWLTNSDPHLRSFISEWAPIWTKEPLVVPVLLLIIIPAAALAILTKNKFAVTVLFLTAAMGAWSVRHIPLAALTAALIISHTLGSAQARSAIKTLKSDRQLRTVFIGLIAIAIGALGAPFLPKNDPEDPAGKYPVEAVEWIKDERPNTILFNHYNWGGYLIAARPEQRVFIDGRMPSWRHHAPEGELDWAADEWQKVDRGDTEAFFKLQQQFHISTLLWPNKAKSPLLTKLQEAGWKVVYTDSTAVVMEPAQ